MISKISIENFIIIDKLEVVFDNNFTAITGETGTGKSIILDAINFCFGKFSAKDVIKYSEKPCRIEIEFDLNKSALSSELGNKLKIKRILSPQGKSNYYLNNESISSKELKELMSSLLNITAQHDSILSTEYQYDVFDKFLRKSNKAAEENILRISDIYSSLRRLEHDIQDLEYKFKRETQYKSYNNQIVAELSELDIKENEETNLLARRSEISKLCSNNNLIKSSLELLQAGFGSSLYQAIKNLTRINSDVTDKIAKRLEDIDIESSDIISELKSFTENISCIEAELEEIDERLSVLRTVARKYNTSAGTLFEFLQEARNNVNSIENTKLELESLKSEQTELTAQYNKVAEKLSELRKVAAVELTKVINSNLQDLLMPNAVFKVEVKSNDLCRKQDGVDEIEFLASFNKEKILRSISQIASGGEAARLNFALKLALAQYSDCDVIIFDEVDIGIGGAAAYAMGKLMKRFANQNAMQVISITHSPQVAAISDHHILVKKQQDNQNIHVELIKLDNKERINEIARMISGDIINKEAILAAEQLIYSK